MTPLEQLVRLRATGPGLAGLAGGWEGSEALADDALRPAHTLERPLPDPE